MHSYMQTHAPAHPKCNSHLPPFLHARALEYIHLLASDPPPGSVFNQRKVVGVQSFGAFVELGPGRQVRVCMGMDDMCMDDCAWAWSAYA